LQKMGNGGDRVVAVALRLGSRQQRAQGAIAGQRKGSVATMESKAAGCDNRMN
jgi:hypothetical protein